MLDSTFTRKDSADFFSELYSFQSTYQGTAQEDLVEAVTTVVEYSYSYWNTNGTWTKAKASPEFWRIVGADGRGAVLGFIFGGGLVGSCISAPLSSAGAGLMVAFGF